MKRARDISLKRYNSFGIDARAARAVQFDTAEDVAAAAFDPKMDLVLGGGTNILLAKDIAGTVFLNRLRGLRVVEDDGDSVLVEAAAGEIWHSLVLWALARGFSGIENLSLIPGLCGAAPMQNIGAYGVELSDVLDRVVAWDWQQRQTVSFTNRDCAFGYRDSRFKRDDRNRYLITAIRLRLGRTGKPRLAYAELAGELKRMGATEPTAREVSQAVISLRKRKLPDPARLGNAGSFFKNPERSADEAEALRSRFPGLPVWTAGAQRCKLGAAWMIERCGWKGHRRGDAGVSEKHALVLVNHGSASGRDLLALAARINASVEETFGVRLEPEPHIVGEDRGSEAVGG